MTEHTPRLRLLAACISMSFATLAGAQPAGEPSEPKDVMIAAPPMFVVGGAVAPLGGMVDILGSADSVSGAVVKDKPYSGTGITESAQILTDGNRIVSRNETRFFRDKAGRTRREQVVTTLGAWQPSGDPATIVTIDDPVAGFSFVTDSSSNTVRMLSPRRVISYAAAEGGFVQWTSAVPAPAGAAGAGAVSVAVAPFDEAAPGTPAAAGGVIVRRIEGGEPQTFEFRAAQPAGVPATPGVLTAARVTSALPADVETTTEDIGEQILEGVRARGTRETQTIPAGAVGNERPIRIVKEEWYAEEIEAVVLRRNVDPRFGETTYRLINVALGEPSSDLFVIPEEHRMEVGTVGLRTRPADAAGESGQPARRVFLVQPAPPPDPTP